MNSFSESEDEDPIKIPSKYTQLSEGDPYFFDFSKKQGDMEAFNKAKKKYLDKYPEFEKMLEVLDIISQTQRAEYDRLENLAIGFLRSVDLNNFEHWESVSRQKWNYQVLTHKRVPQEFYAAILSTANKIRNEYFEQEPIYDRILSKINDHTSLYDMLCQYKFLDVSEWQLREIMIPIGLQAIITKNPWKKGPKFYINQSGKTITADEYIKKVLSKVVTILSYKKTVSYPKNSECSDKNLPSMPVVQYNFGGESVIRINPKKFFEGFEEAVDLSILLGKKEYTEILRVFQTTRSSLGRLQDQDFQPFYGYYEYIGKFFLLYHRFSDTRPGLQRRHFQSLAQLFNTELGITQAKIRAEVSHITHGDIEQIHLPIEALCFNTLIGI